MQPDTATRPEEAPGAPSRGYASYLLGVLVLVYVFNFLDRQIVSILAERIKADIGATDAQMGFLYGTAFAVFFALFGIPLGRLADMWDRRKLIAIGLSFWSLMTAVSGFARTFSHLALARIGVGVGEASATPAAFSMLSDAFPPARRATALAIYSSGIYLGAGLGLGLGGLIVDRWDVAWAGTTPPLGLRGWQVAFMAVGLPGLLLAIWVATLREPARGVFDGIPAPKVAHPFREFLREVACVVPPLTIVHLILQRYGAQAVVSNLVAMALVAMGAIALTALLGSPEQWTALAIGVYAAISWAQALRRRDPPAFALIFRTPTLRWSVLGFSLLAFTGYGTGFWLPPFLIRVHGASEAEVGLIFGSIAAVGGWLGVTSGGLLADRWRSRDPNGRLWVGLVTALAPLPLALGMYTTESRTLAYVLGLPLSLLTALWIGPAASTVQDLVLPRMRGAASGAYLLVVTFVGLALGPYTIGRLSLAVGHLGHALSIALVVNLLAALLFVVALRHLGRDEASRVERARAAGEPV
ncbi:MAG: MFS transporter [Deltaproteobacteria bacterium]|nr:MFS transporter [Deltaproteobacteria bacterium]